MYTQPIALTCHQTFQNISLTRSRIIDMRIWKMRANSELTSFMLTHVQSFSHAQSSPCMWNNQQSKGTTRRHLPAVGM